MNFRNLPKAQTGVPDDKKFPPSTFTQFFSLYDKKAKEFKDQYKANNTSFIGKNPEYINLTTGRFNTAKVPSYVIDIIASTAKRQNFPIGKALALVGRESTFGVGKDGERAGDLEQLASAWNPAKDFNYSPYNPLRFLADNKVPGIETVKTNFNWFYKINDQNKLYNYINNHPELLDRYKKKLEQTKPLGNLNALDLAIMKVKKQGIENYNPGDAKYKSMYEKDYKELQSDPAIQKYFSEKGYIFKYGGKKGYFFRPRKSSIFATGGMTARQFYSFLFDGDDDYYNDETSQVVKKNTAPSESELKELKQQNEDLLFKLEQANMRNASFDVINAPSTIDPSSSYTSPDYSQFYNIGTLENQTFPSFSNRSSNMISLKPKVWGKIPEYINNKSTSFPNITKIYGFAE